MNKEKEIINLLKAEREKRGMSYKDFGMLIGSTGRAVSYWEAGKRVITLDKADRALRVLQKSVTLGKERS